MKDKWIIKSSEYDPFKKERKFLDVWAMIQLAILGGCVLIALIYVIKNK